MMIKYFPDTNKLAMITELLSRLFILNLLFSYFPLNKLFSQHLGCKLQGNTQGLCGIFSRKSRARANSCTEFSLQQDRGLGQVYGQLSPWSFTLDYTIPLLSWGGPEGKSLAGTACGTKALKNPSTELNFTPW